MRAMGIPGANNLLIRMIWVFVFGVYVLGRVICGIRAWGIVICMVCGPNWNEMRSRGDEDHVGLWVLVAHGSGVLRYVAYIHVWRKRRGRWV